MISVTPQGQIYLCKTPLVNDYKNQLTFSNLINQKNYFASKVFKSFEDENYTYIKKDSVIYINEPIDNIIGCNYLYYVNKGFTEKTYYCFITNMEYENENCTKITFETDCFQTWYFDINYHQSFIKREHVSDDTIGLHTIPENLDVGDVICEETEELMSLDDGDYEDVTEGCYIVVETTFNPAEAPSLQDLSGVTCINGNISGSWVLAFSFFGGLTSNIDLYIQHVMREKSADVIKNMYIAPKELIDSLRTEDKEIRDLVHGTYRFKKILNSTESVTRGKVIKAIQNFSGINIKNNKCFCYPYNYMLASNNVGNNIIYKYEDFTIYNNPDIANYPCLFMDYEMALSIGCSIRLIPREYKNKAKDYNETIPLAKFPTCAWSGDAFTNWLTQNAVNIGTSITEIVGGTALGFATGGVLSTAGMGVALSGATKTAGLIGEFREAKLKPSIEGGSNSGDVNYSSGKNTFIISHMRAKNEYLKIIDEYFSKYGYKVNIIKNINFNSRLNWNYIETEDCNITGDIPQEDLKIIKQMFNNGVTMWHNPSTIFDYSQSNNII